MYGLKAFIITNASGEAIDSKDHFEDALQSLRDLPSAHDIVRRSDGTLLARRASPTLTTRMRGAA